MTREDIIKMAREAGLLPIDIGPTIETWQMRRKEESLVRFAALVAAAEREKVAAWMMGRGYATGHGDSTDDLLQELDWQIAENWNRALINGITTEREACAKVVEILIPEQTEDGLIGHTIAKAIRARGEQ